MRYSDDFLGDPGYGEPTAYGPSSVCLKAKLKASQAGPVNIALHNPQGWLSGCCIDYIYSDTLNGVAACFYEPQIDYAGSDT